MKDRSLLINILKWIPVLLWGWFLIHDWTAIPLPQFIIPNYALTAFVIMSSQIFLYADIKKIILLKDKEMNIVFAIGGATIICMFLSNSRPGAFFTIMDFCLLLYVSDKWKWNDKQICFLGVCLATVTISWVIWPMVEPGRNSNMAGTIVVFSMFGLSVLLEKYQKDAKAICWGLEFLLLLVCLRQLIIFHGRGTAIALAFYCFLRFFLPRVWWMKERWVILLGYFLTLGSVVFVFIYTIIWRTVGDIDQIKILGKEIFSGREVIWNEFITRFMGQPFWGTGSNFVPQSYFEFNVHNAMFDILAVHGIFVFALVVFYINKKLRILYKKNLENIVMIPAISGVMAVLLESFTDMDLLWAPQLLVWSFILVVLNSGKNPRPDLEVPGDTAFFPRA